MTKVMLIEDDLTMLNLLGTLLEMENYEVAKLDKFDRVVEDVQREMPDVLLMDVHLNDTDGIELLKQIRKNKPLLSIKVIMSSGMDKSYESEQAGADGFLLKPYMPEELIVKINQLAG